MGIAVPTFIFEEYIEGMHTTPPYNRSMNYFFNFYVRAVQLYLLRKKIYRIVYFIKFVLIVMHFTFFIHRYNFFGV